MRRSTQRIIATATVTATTAAVLAITTATQSNAYDKAGYGYAATHMIELKDIPAVLGKFSPKMTFNVDPGFKNSRIYLCGIKPDADVDTFKQVVVKRTGANFAASYLNPAIERNAESNKFRSVTVNVFSYPSQTAANNAFSQLSQRAKKCTGTRTETYGGDTNPDGSVNPGYTSISRLDNGKVASVVSNGQQGIYVESDYRGTSESQPDDPSLNDNYTIYAPVGNVILQATYTSSLRDRVTKAEAAAVAELTNNAIRAWRG